jgi:hypothetical protein
MLPAHRRFFYPAVSFAFVVFFLSSSLLLRAQQPNSVSEELVTNRTNDLLKQMTLDEKIAQLSQLPGAHVPGYSSDEKPEETIKKLGAGSVLWVPDPKEIDRLQHVAVEQSRLHIPILFGFDVIHGYRTTFPAPLGMASSYLISTDLNLSQIRWTHKAERAWSSEWPRLWNGFLLAGNCRSELDAFRISDGAPEWSDKLKGCLRSIGTDGDNEQIYVGAQEGTVYAYTPPVVASGITK